MVFEVSGVKPAVDAMTAIAAVRGRICMVAIHAQAPEVNLFHFFWKELEMVGARVYEASDFDKAIEIVASGDFDLEPFITSVNSLPDIGGGVCQHGWKPRRHESPAFLRRGQLNLPIEPK